MDTKPVAMKQISSEIEKLDMACSNFHKELTNLYDALYPVSRPEPPISEPDCKTSIELVELASRIRERRRNVESFTERLKSMLDRLEI